MFMLWPFFPGQKEYGTLAWLGGAVAIGSAVSATLFWLAVLGRRPDIALLIIAIMLAGYGVYRARVAAQARRECVEGPRGVVEVARRLAGFEIESVATSDGREPEERLALTMAPVTRSTSVSSTRTSTLS